MTTKRLRPLTDMEKLFVENYLIDLDAKGAAKKAGYRNPDKLGLRLMKKPQIKDAIGKAMEARSKRLHIDQDYVLQELQRVYERAMQDVKPALNSKTGKPINDEDGNAVYRYDSGAALRALELMGKHIGVSAFNPEVNHKHSADDAIMKALMAGRRRVGRTDPTMIDITPKPAEEPTQTKRLEKLPGEDHDPATNAFIIQARQKHGNQFDYSRTKFLGLDAIVTIECDSHGLFSQTARAHIEGQGCPDCIQAQST